MLTKLAKLKIQAKFLEVTRNFFKVEKIVEVVAPVLQSAVPLEPTIYPFQTHWQTQQVRWLSTSPEKTLKAALAAGLPKVYAIGQSFRDLEQAGDFHQPEFLMLEWYRCEAGVELIIQDLKKLLLALQQVTPDSKLDLNNWQTLSIAAEFEKLTGRTLETVLTNQAMAVFASGRGYEVKDATWEQLFNQWFLNELEPKIGSQPTIVTDFPARISPLCQNQAARPLLANRFEIYLQGIEIANGNQEKTDVNQIKLGFETERNLRLNAGLPAPDIDTDFLASLTQLAGQKISGIGVGLERVWMILAGETQI